jgi:hypothetical protein
MFNRIIVVVLLLMPGPAWAAPLAWVSDAAVQVGRVKQGAPARAEFVVHNRGDANLVLEPKACCGLSVRAPQGLVIVPGGRSRLSLSYETAGLSGGFRKVLAVRTNDPQRPELRLELAGQILVELEIRPEVLDFGQVAAGVQTRRRLSIVNHSERAMPLGEHQLRPAGRFSLAGTLPESLAPGQSLAVEVVFSAPRQRGSVWGAFSFRAGAAGQAPRSVPLRAVVR